MSTDEWGDPVETTRKPAHNFELQPVVIGTFQRTDQIATRDPDTGEPRKSNMHRFIDDNGEPVDCWGSSMLDDLLRGVAQGSRCRLQFLGRESLPNGNTIKRFELRLSDRNQPVHASDQTSLDTDNDDDIPF